MKTKLLILLVILALAFLLVGCGKTIPTVEQAPYRLSTSQAGRSFDIYVANYYIKDGNLYTDSYWSYKSGSIFDPIYEYHNTPLIVSEFALYIR